MKQQTTRHEILMFTGTSLSKRELCEKNGNSEIDAGISPAEKLEKACWAGLLFELLPELADITPDKSKTYIWNIMRGEHFLHISLGPYPAAEEKDTSLDPYFFLPAFYMS